jgi:hypothetical protein
MIMRKELCLAVAMLAAMTASANANFVTVTLGSSSHLNSVQYTHKGVDKSGYVGAVSAAYNAPELPENISDALGGITSNAQIFCTEVDETVNFSTYRYDVVDLQDVPSIDAGMGPTRAALMEKLYGSSRAGLSGNVQFAGFQLAVWEIANDYDGTSGSINLADGDFKRRNNQTGNIASAWSAAQSFLTAALSSSDTTALLGLKISGIQDFIVENPTPPEAPVPEPTSVALWSFGLLGLAAMRRRKSA